MKTTEAIQALNTEGEHYKELARGLALGVLLNPDPTKEKLAREHLIRAETYHAAARLIAQPAA